MSAPYSINDRLIDSPLGVAFYKYLQRDHTMLMDLTKFTERFHEFVKIIESIQKQLVERGVGSAQALEVAPYGYLLQSEAGFKGEENPINRCFHVHCTSSQNDTSDTSTLLRCSACRVAMYCNRECQRSNWPEHKTICRIIQGKINTETSDSKSN